VPVLAARQELGVDAQIDSLRWLAATDPKLYVLHPKRPVEVLAPHRSMRVVVDWFWKEKVDIGEVAAFLTQSDAVEYIRSRDRWQT
jgi:hypothetical protein